MKASNLSKDSKLNSNTEKSDLRPFIKWAGGKERELKDLQKYFPTTIRNYFEPFLGGGAVFFHMYNAEIKGDAYINDFSTELMNIYTAIRDQDSNFITTLDSIAENFVLMKNLTIRYGMVSEYAYGKVTNHDDVVFAAGLTHNIICLDHLKLRGNLEPYTQLFLDELKTSLVAKYKQLSKVNDKHGVDIDNQEALETAFKMAFYNTVRSLYNTHKQIDGFKCATLYFVRQFCFSSMFRFNADGDFNIPYGGKSYNSKNFNAAVDYLKSEELVEYLKKSHISNLDFREYFKIWRATMSQDDFVFVDPPYDTAFSEYDKNEFNRDDQKKLAELLHSFGEFGAKVMVVIKKTDFIYDLYKSYGFNIMSYQKKYSVNCRNRNDRAAEHLIITNYEVPDS